MDTSEPLVPGFLESGILACFALILCWAIWAIVLAVRISRHTRGESREGEPGKDTGKDLRPNHGLGELSQYEYGLSSLMA